jgi:3-oxoacyl-[acyl-carrier-protein] synthase III
MQPVSLLATASYLPEKVIENDFFESYASAIKNKMFAGAVRRRHVAEDETAASMIEKAANKLIRKTGIDPSKDIDILLTNVSLPDEFFLGCGSAVSHAIGARPSVVIDLHNSGCISFVYMLDLACALIRSGKGKTALICNVQNAAGQLFAQSEVRKKPQSIVPGDGCGVAYLAMSDENPILSSIHHCYGEYAADMYATCDDGRKYWETGEDQLYIDFTEHKIATLFSRGNSIVPHVIREACELAKLPVKDIGALITNQPNKLFLRNWREALELPVEKHFDTFSEYGNLFGAGIPITLDETLAAGKIHAGDYIVLGGFSHAGDFSGAAVIHWKNKCC